MYFIIFNVETKKYIEEGKNSENPEQLKEKLINFVFPNSTKNEKNKNYVECKKLNVYQLAQKLNYEIESSREKF